jgi:hypothetical protein
MLGRLNHLAGADRSGMWLGRDCRGSSGTPGPATQRAV